MVGTKRRRLRLQPIVMSVANILVTLFLVLPLFVLILGAIQTEKSLVEDYLSLIPTQVTFENFMVILLGREDILQGHRLLPSASNHL